MSYSLTIGRLYKREKLQIIIRVCICKVNSNAIDKSNDIKQLREQIRKLDERLDCEMQVLYSPINKGLCRTSCVINKRFLHLCV